MIEQLLSHSQSYFDDLLVKKLPKLKLKIDRSNVPVIYSAGVVGQSVCASLYKKLGVKVKYVVDRNEKLWGQKLGEARIISPSEARKKFVNEPIFVASVIYETEIVKLLKKSGFTKIYPMSYLNYLNPELFDYRDYNAKYFALFARGAKNKINIIYDLLADKKSKSIFNSIISFRLKHYYGVKMDTITSNQDQYFEKNIVKLSNDEIFVDGGAYDGDTIRKIIDNPNWKTWKIYAFEPDPKNFMQLTKTIRHTGVNVKAIRAGLWKNLDTLKFFGLGSPESGIGSDIEFTSWSGSINPSELNAKVVDLPVVSLDTYFRDIEIPTYIKMDIEGAEKEALIGAKKLIRKYKPKLAICIYHKPSDLWELPTLIKKLNPNYKLYIRHYSREVCETVCYAI